MYKFKLLPAVDRVVGGALVVVDRLLGLGLVPGPRRHAPPRGSIVDAVGQLSQKSMGPI